MTTDKKHKQFISPRMLFFENFPLKCEHCKWDGVMERRRQSWPNLCEKKNAFKSEVFSIGCDTNEQNSNNKKNTTVSLRWHLSVAYVIDDWKCSKEETCFFRWFPFITALMCASIWIHLLLELAMGPFIRNWIDSGVFFVAFIDCDISMIFRFVYGVKVKRFGISFGRQF